METSVFLGCNGDPYYHNCVFTREQKKSPACFLMKKSLSEGKERNIIDNYMIKPVSDLDILNEMR